MSVDTERPRPGAAVPEPGDRPHWTSRLRAIGRPPRLMGLDVARALAIIGMIAVHADVDRRLVWSEPSTWSGIAHGRSSILFALVAGVSLALATGGRDRPEGEDLRQARLRLVGRALAILTIGLVLELLGTPIAIILTVYGVLFVVVLPFLAMRRRTLLLVAAVVGLLGPVVLSILHAVAVRPYEPGLALVVRGSYPLCTWLPLLLVGLALGRSELRSTGFVVRVLVAAAAASTAAFVAGWRLAPHLQEADPFFFADPDDRSPYVQRFHEAGGFGGVPFDALSTQPHSGGTLELLASGGFVVALLCLCLLLARPLRWPLLPLACLGTMPLTAYTLHVVSYALVDRPFGLVPDLASGGSTGLRLWAVTVVVLLAAAVPWAVLIGRGPLERVTAWAGRAMDGTS